MKQIIIKFLLIPLFLILSNCGYKVLNNSETINFSIKEINTLGDKRINFKIKNSLIVDASKNAKNNAIVSLKTKKTKKTKKNFSKSSKNKKKKITKRSKKRGGRKRKTKKR